MILGSSGLKCVGEEWVREDFYSEGGVVTGHFMLLFLHVVVCMQVSQCFWLSNKMLHSRKLLLVRTLTTYPEGAPLFRKGGNMAPGS